MAFCIDCGYKINDWAETCLSCGKSQAEAIALEIGVPATPEPTAGWFRRELLLKSWQLGLAALAVLSVGILIGTLIVPDSDVGAEAPLATLAPAPTLAATEAPIVPPPGTATPAAIPTPSPIGTVPTPAPVVPFPTQPVAPTTPVPVTPVPVTTPATQFP